MKTDMIKDLYYGEIVPANLIDCKTKEYLDARDIFNALKKRLESSFDSNQAKLLDDIIEAKESMYDELIYIAFKIGFVL